MINIKKIISVILLVSVLLLTYIVVPITASASTTLAYTDVLYDLQRDTEFDASKYSVLTFDYFNSLNTDADKDNDLEYVNVIHVGEGNDGKLFVYTYQPLEQMVNITASSINMAVGKNSEKYESYTLKLVSSNGTLKKYLVEGFTVPAEIYRYYKIVEIERPYDVLLDEKISDDTEINYKAHPVGQEWCVYFMDGSVVYEMTTVEYVEIKPTLTDFVYYKDGFRLGNLVGVQTACYSHFIAFNITNWNPDKIIDADIIYKSRKYQDDYIDYFIGDDVHNITYPEGENYKENRKFLSNDVPVVYDAQGLTKRKYTWDRISTASNFVINFESQGGVLNKTTRDTLLSSQFVFAFAETAYGYSSNTYTPENGIGGYTWTIKSGTEILDVDILRIKFEQDGKTYNLGVVMDTTSGDDIAGGGATPELGIDIEGIKETFSEWFAKIKESMQKIMKVLIIVIFVCAFVGLGLPLLIPLIKLIIKTISRFVKFVINSISSVFKQISRHTRNK